MSETRQGKCPRCKGKNLNYSAVEFQGNMCYFPFVCYELGCGATGKEWYHLKYIESKLSE